MATQHGIASLRRPTKGLILSLSLALITLFALTSTYLLHAFDTDGPPCDVHPGEKGLSGLTDLTGNPRQRNCTQDDDKGVNYAGWDEPSPQTNHYVVAGYRWAHSDGCTWPVCDLNGYYRPVRHIRRRPQAACTSVCDCVTVIITVGHCLRSAAQTVESLHEYYPGTAVVLVDGSDKDRHQGTPEEMEAINRLSSKTHVSYIRSSQGAQNSRQVAAEAARTRYVLFVEDDVMFTRDTDLKFLLYTLESTDLTIVAGHSDAGRPYEGVFRVYQTDIKPKAEARLMFYPGVFYEQLWAFVDCYALDYINDFFLARRTTILESGVLGGSSAALEHEDFLLNVRMRRLKTAYCPKITISQTYDKRPHPGRGISVGDTQYDKFLQKWGLHAMFICDKNEYTQNFRCKHGTPYGGSNYGLLVMFCIVVLIVVCLIGRTGLRRGFQCLH